MFCDLPRRLREGWIEEDDANELRLLPMRGVEGGGDQFVRHLPNLRGHSMTKGGVAIRLDKGTQLSDDITYR